MSRKQQDGDGAKDQGADASGSSEDDGSTGTAIAVVVCLLVVGAAAIVGAVVYKKHQEGNASNSRRVHRTLHISHFTFHIFCLNIARFGFSQNGAEHRDFQ